MARRTMKNVMVATPRNTSRANAILRKKYAQVVTLVTRFGGIDGKAGLGVAAGDAWGPATAPGGAGWGPVRSEEDLWVVGIDRPVVHADGLAVGRHSGVEQVGRGCLIERHPCALLYCCWAWWGRSRSAYASSSVFA